MIFPCKFRACTGGYSKPAYWHAGSADNGGGHYGATDESGRKAALLREWIADAPAFAAAPALAWSAPPWRRGRGRLIVE